jgi:zinc protease
VAVTTSAMLNEGTTVRSAQEIARSLEFYGAYLNLACDKDTAELSVYTLNKHLVPVLDVVEDILKNSVFPKNELVTFVLKAKQHFMVESTKVRTLAIRKFAKELFGENHPYGTNPQLADYDSLTRRQLLTYFSRLYDIRKARIVLAGKVTPALMTELEKRFGQGTKARKAKPVIKIIDSGQAGQVHVVEKADAVQSAIRIGKVLFNKMHDDFIGMQILNKVLGGYFGSRLMANIREDKGYTYGIGSMMISLRNAGYFGVSTEVRAEVTRDAVKEIMFEIGRLRDELIPEEELALVKNYILGELLRAFDGPFALADSFRAMMEYGLDYDYYSKLVENVKQISPADLRNLAGKYLQENSLITVVAGKYE